MPSYRWKVSREYIPVRLYIPPSIYAGLQEAIRDYQQRGDEDEQLNKMINTALAVWLQNRKQWEQEYEKRLHESSEPRQPA